MKRRLLAVPVLLACILLSFGGARSSEEPHHAIEVTQLTTPVPVIPLTEVPQEAPATTYAVIRDEQIRFEEEWREEAEHLARMAWGEARGCTTMHQAATMWCVLNRVDSSDPFYPDDIIGVTTQHQQFHGYNSDHPLTAELYDLALDVLERWQREKDGETGVGRVLPKEYLWFSGDGTVNTFRDGYQWPYNTWDWGLENPYEE